MTDVQTVIDAPSRPTLEDAPVSGQALRSWFVLIVRQIAISGITVGGVLALTHQLSPSQFALYGYASSAMMVAAAVGDLGIGAALITGELQPRQLGGALGLQLVVWLPLGAISAAAVIVFGVYHLTPAEAVLLAAAFVFLSLQALPTAILDRRLAFGVVSRLEVAQRLLFVVVAVILAAVSASGIGIAAAAAIAAVAGYAVSLAITGWRWWPQLRRVPGAFSRFASQWWQGRLASQLNYAVYPLLGGLLFSARELGYIVWALAITQLPALFSPLAARALLPSLRDRSPDEQMQVFRRMLTGVLAVGLPPLAALFALARPLTVYLLGAKWLPAITVLRLECFTTLLGLGLTTGVPVFYRLLDPHSVKRVLVGWCAAVWMLTPAFATVASFRAPSIAQITAALVALVVFDRLLERRLGISPIRSMTAGLCAFAIGCAVGLVAVPFAVNAATTLALAVGVAGLTLLFMVVLRGTRDTRRLVSEIRSTWVRTIET